MEKNVNRLHGIIRECVDAIVDEMKQSYDDLGWDAETAFANVSTNDGYIALSADRDGCVAEVWHDNESEGDCPTLCAAIAAACPSWESVMWERSNERDEHRPIGLDPAFSSWSDFWNYKGY